MLINQDIVLEDTTLRDGEQAPGVAWSKEQKREIFEALVRVGVKWIEVGIPKMGGDELRFLSEVVEYKSELMLVAWNRGVRDDVKQSLDLGFEAVHIGLPTSDVHLKQSVGKNRAWVLETASDLVNYAKDRGAFVSISAEDVGRTDEAFLVDYAGRLSELGADRMRLSDTIGIMTPEKYARKIELVKSSAEVDVQCHCHNDFGLAVANTLAGLKAGAKYFHVCVNGLGERAGMPDLAQMVMALKKLYDVDLKIDTRGLRNLSEVVSQETRVKLPPWAPVVGDNVCAHESGIHAKGVLNDSNTFEPFSADEVGGTQRIVIGKHSGRAAVRSCVIDADLVLNDDVLFRCLEAVRAEAIRKQSALDATEVVAIYQELLETASGRPDSNHEANI